MGPLIVVRQEPVLARNAAVMLRAILKSSGDSERGRAGDRGRESLRLRCHQDPYHTHGQIQDSDQPNYD